jgi:2OG-Fe(II) oxygenase superfamily
MCDRRRLPVTKRSPHSGREREADLPEKNDQIAIQLGRSGLTCDRGRIAELRDEFREKHCVRLPQLLEPSLVSYLQQRLKSGSWQTKVHAGIGEEYVLKDVPALNLLFFLANTADFRGLIEELTGCGPLRRFQGRVYRMIAGSGHYDSWHSDEHQSRLIGMSVNLSPDYRGGLFLLRERQSGRRLREIANTGLGDALIFRISSELEHRISDVEGEEPKTAFAGWFSSDGSEFFKELQENSTDLKAIAR